jgi:hypothetical protein
MLENEKNYFGREIILPIEVVPTSSHYNNLRKMLKQYQWTKLRKIIIPPLDNKCIICGGQSYNRQLDLHEVWEYDCNTGIQKLIDLQGLCTSCHNVKHYYLSSMRGNYDIVSKRLKEINNFSDKELIEYELFINNLFKKRSLIDWKLDVSLIENYDLKYKG